MLWNGNVCRKNESNENIMANMEDVHVKVYQDCHCKRSIQQEEDSLHQQTGFTFKEVTSKMLYMEYSSVWC